MNERARITYAPRYTIEKDDKTQFPKWIKVPSWLVFHIDGKYEGFDNPGQAVDRATQRAKELLANGKRNYA